MKLSDIGSASAAATLPTPLTRFWRTFLPYQFFRFIVINFKMLRLILRSHDSASSMPRVNAKPEPETNRPTP